MSAAAKRKPLGLLAALVLALAACGAQAQSVAFTFDDGPRLAETAQLSLQQRNQALLRV